MTIASAQAAYCGDRESLWALFKTVTGVSAVSWGGLAMMAQLERHYVEHERRIDPLSFADLVALAWMMPGPVGCNVAVQVGHALRGRAGAWIAGIASVLPFFAAMTVFAIFYQTPLVRSLASPVLLHHFSMVLAALIGLTWFRQVRALVHAPLERAIAALATVLLGLAHSPAAFVAILAAAFGVGWLASGRRQGEALRLALRAREWRLLASLALLIALFALPLPIKYESSLLWPRLAGAGMTLFGGGFSALPVLKSLFVTRATGITEQDFMLAFTLSPVSPGPLLNVVPFLGYLEDGWRGALLSTIALFVPSGCLVIFARQHVERLKLHPRFASGMRVLRAATTAFLAIAAVRLVAKTPAEPVYWATGAIAWLCLARFKVPVYALYGAVAAACGVWLFLAAHG
ncbi:chromate transporter [Burkholderia thailandensis]|uniref:Chromate transport protein, putative n=1 Tax=Burkholderia thailandensis (strain ATCC 700388 / DSM 13276 / CCUG 48851 / CIP 106301 / E264) TaxID=271848 RepID=Q2SZZ8_BURTA|nr:chromate transporter [Burkholderia thailandensis]ABC38774.1 chromate transport protein, putative [Burkholderia thailandensis E264]AHI71989.1 chromate transporter family protein [Burkholderia thailandensis 2002721723]AHI77975.1 chromate transporter family protein [Burkholderia thailandensis E444]AIC85645.1 chromate transporter family protein [Burkholderia thailandensis USAMRU Malaysia \